MTSESYDRGFLQLAAGITFPKTLPRALTTLERCEASWPSDHRPLRLSNEPFEKDRSGDPVLAW